MNENFILFRKRSGLLPVRAGLLVAVEEEDELEVDLLAHGLVPTQQVVLVPTNKQERV